VLITPTDEDYSLSLAIRNVDEECAICFDKVAQSYNIPCGHIFHMGCLDEWFLLNNKCPVCRDEWPSAESYYESRDIGINYDEDTNTDYGESDEEDYIDTDTEDPLFTTINMLQDEAPHYYNNINPCSELPHNEYITSPQSDSVRYSDTDSLITDIIQFLYNVIDHENSALPLSGNVQFGDTVELPIPQYRETPFRWAHHPGMNIMRSISFGGEALTMPEWRYTPIHQIMGRILYRSPNHINITDNNNELPFYRFTYPHSNRERRALTQSITDID
jgi:hypothetical protein